MQYSRWASIIEVRMKIKAWRTRWVGGVWASRLPRKGWAQWESLGGHCRLSGHCQSLNLSALYGCLQHQVGTDSCGHTSVVGSREAAWFSPLKSRQMRPGYHVLENMFNNYLSRNLLEVIYWMSTPFIFNEKTKPFGIITLWNYRTYWLIFCHFQNQMRKNH